MRKTICMIRSNAVDPDSRVEKEAASLKKIGYNVIILAWDRSSNHRLKHEFINVYGEKIDIYRFGYKAGFGEGMKSIIPYLRFQFSQFRWLICNRKIFDAIHACDFDTAFFSGIANFLIRKKFIFDIFDFLYGNPQNYFQSFIKKLQIYIINRADATIICTEKRKEQIKLAKPKNLTVIHNTPIFIENGCIKFENNYNLKNRKVKIVYVGILQEHRLLREIGEIVKKNPQYELHIGGYGKLEGYFQQLNNEFSNIIYYGKLSYEKTLELENKCDIMLAIYDPKIENHYYAAPNKFYESLMLGKPVIMVKKTGMSEYVERFEIGELIEFSANSFKEGVESLISKEKKWKIISDRMKKIYEREFRWKIMADRLNIMYKNIFK